MDYYNILGVQKTASQDDIKRAYRKLAKEHHPDKGGNAEKFKQINEAYDTLKDANKRQQYDNPAQNEFGGDPGGFWQERHYTNPFDINELFRRAAGQHHQQMMRNRDLTIYVTLSLEEVFTGKDVLAEYRLGSGKLETVNINVPAGARHGDTIKYDNLGDDSNPRFPRGALLVKVQLKSHKEWVRDGNNLATKRSVNVFDIMLGCAIIIETLDKKRVKLNIPKGTKPGTVLSIGGYGIPDLRTKKRGNLYIQIEPEIPNITNNDVLKKIQDIKRIIEEEK